MNGALSSICVCTAALLCAACGPQKELEGSLSTVVTLKYDKAEFVQSQDEFALRFIKARSSGEDTPLKVAYNLTGSAIERNTDMDLSAQRPEGGPRTTVTRDVYNDPVTTFPAIQRGTIRFYTLPVSGQRVQGEFNITFVEGKDFGCGRTVYGPFEATVP